MFYEPDYKSCTKLIATIAREKFGFDTKPLADLIHWGDIIDGAQYATPQAAVELAEPATQLALVIEAAPENGLPAQIIPELAYCPLSEMVSCRWWPSIWGRFSNGTANRSKFCASESKLATALFF